LGKFITFFFFGAISSSDDSNNLAARTFLRFLVCSVASNSEWNPAVLSFFLND